MPHDYQFADGGVKERDLAHWLMTLRDSLIEVANRYGLPQDAVIRIAQVTDHRKPVNTDDLTVELFTELIEPPVLPPAIVEFHDKHMADIRVEILDLMRPYEPFQCLRLRIRRDADGMVRIDGSEGKL